MPCIPEFILQFPRCRFSLIETQAEEIPRLVDDGTAELGFTLDYQRVRTHFPLLAIEPWYQLDVMLVMHRKHPLSRKRKVASRLGLRLGYAGDGLACTLDLLPTNVQMGNESNALGSEW